MFDSREELNEKIRLGEDSLLELKALRFAGTRIAGPRREELADELAAFANAGGGVLVLGVDDKTRQVEGIPLDRLDQVEGFVVEVLNDSIDPPLHALVIRLELPDASGTPRAVLKIEVPGSPFVHKSPGGYFRRSGSSKRELSPDLLARLFEERGRARLVLFEQQAVPGSSLADLSGKLWKRFVSVSEDPPEILLEKRGIVVRDGQGVLRASVAGILMASEEPERFLPAAFIEAVCYLGTDRDSNHQLDALRICGPLDEQVRQAMAFLRRNQKTSAVKIPYRVETPQFSERAVFEAVVNAVAHRDYSIHASKIRFFIFADRLELYSPGAPPNTLTIFAAEPQAPPADR